jgi:hypothetical protein
LDRGEARKVEYMALLILSLSLYRKFCGLIPFSSRLKATASGAFFLLGVFSVQQNI